jgi:hypothetical protein
MSGLRIASMEKRFAMTGTGYYLAETAITKGPGPGYHLRVGLEGHEMFVFDVKRSVRAGTTISDSDISGFTAL